MRRTLRKSSIEFNMRHKAFKDGVNTNGVLNCFSYHNVILCRHKRLSGTVCLVSLYSPGVRLQTFWSFWGRETRLYILGVKVYVFGTA